MLIYVKCNLYHARDTQEGNIKDKAKSAVYVPESTISLDLRVLFLGSGAMLHGPKAEAMA